VTALFLVAPAAAAAWTVTVSVHGAGKVVEVDNRFGDNQGQMNCSVSPNGRSESSTPVNCVGGTASGLYNSGNIVRLAPEVPTEAFNRGWRYQKWVDGTSSGQINCDPQDTTGNHFTPTYCEFQIFQNLAVDLYFEDIHGPNSTSVSGGPATFTNSTSASFSFNATDDPDADFECRLDPPGSATGSYASCGSPSDKSESYSSLTTNGEYMFYVRGKDPSGNVDQTPASHSWTVDTVAPSVSIAGGPAAGSTTNSASASFTVGSSEGVPTCTLDGSPTSCSTAKTGLAEGLHTFAAQATDGAGNTGSASRTWTVDTVDPTVTIGGTPADGATTNSTEASFTVGTSEGVASCTLDGTATPCNTPPTGLDDGVHTFAAQATDGAGNTGSASRTWTVDTVDPEATITRGPSGNTTDRTPTFRFNSDEAGTFKCSVDGGRFKSCSSPHTTARLAFGRHTFKVRATDVAGNRGPVDSETFKVVRR
jgi:hypothetical protein